MTRDFSKNNKEKICFKIDNSFLYTEKVLMEKNGVPTYFICNNAKNKFLALLVDSEKYVYVVVKASQESIENLLNGKLSFRDAIINQPNYMLVEVGDDVISDRIEVHNMNDIDKTLLPPTEIMYRKELKNKKNDQLQMEKKTIENKEIGPMEIVFSRNGDLVSDFAALDFADKSIAACAGKTDVTKIKVGTEMMMNAFVFRALEHKVRNIAFYQGNEQIMFDDENGLTKLVSGKPIVQLGNMLEEKMTNQKFQNMSDNMMKGFDF